MRKKVASGAIAGAMAITSTVVGMMWPTLDPSLGYPILIACGAVFLIAMAVYLWPERPEPNAGGLSQSTSGDASHNISAARDVHYHNHPPAPAYQERKTDHWVRPKDNAAEYIRERVSALNQGLRAGLGPLPDMELREVVDRLCKDLDGPPELISDFEGRVDRKIKDGVLHWKLHTWGRKNDPNAALDAVWKDAWLKGDFKHAQGWIRFRHPDNPRTAHKWTDLHFNRAEVDKWLPPKPEYEMIVV